MPGLKPLQSKAGFTLAEVLIALAILAEIATFTIPKILSAQQDGRNNAVAKEAAAAMSAAIEQYRLNGLLTTSTGARSITQYLNYVSVDTSGSSIDSNQTTGSVPCAASHPCIRLASGAAIRCGSGAFSGTALTNAIMFTVDPDGQDSGTTNGPGKAVTFYIYYNGRISTRGEIAAGTLYAGAPVAADPAQDPPWFRW